MRLLRCLATLLLLLSLGASPVSAQEPIKAGKLSFANGFRFAGEVFEKGRYEVSLEHGSDGAYIVLARDGKEVLREFAIVVATKSERKRARAALTTLTRDGGRIRVAVRHGMATYLAFFEAQS